MEIILSEDNNIHWRRINDIEVMDFEHPKATGTLSLAGGQVLAWQPAGQDHDPGRGPADRRQGRVFRPEGTRPPGQAGDGMVGREEGELRKVMGGGCHCQL